MTAEGEIGKTLEGWIIGKYEVTIEASVSGKTLGNNLGNWGVSKIGIYEGIALGYSDTTQKNDPK